MRQYSGSPSGGYTSHPPTSLLRTPRACWSTHGPGGAWAACGAPGQTGWGAEDLILDPFFQDAPESLYPTFFIIEDGRGQWQVDLPGLLESKGYRLLVHTQLNLLYERAPG